MLGDSGRDWESVGAGDNSLVGGRGWGVDDGR